MQGFHPGLFGGIFGGFQTRQGIHLLVAFESGIADVMVDHQLDASQARITPVQAGNPTQVRMRIVTTRAERAAQPNGGTRPGQEIQIGEDQLVRYAGQFIVGGWIADLVVEQEQVNKRQDSLERTLTGPATGIQTGVETLRPGGLQ